MKKKTRIGIMTIANSKNYGACLQMYALYHFIKTLESDRIDCEVINYKRPIDKSFYRLTSDTKNGLKSLAKGIVYSSMSLLSQIRKRKHFMDFRKMIAFTKVFGSRDELYNAPPSFDVYVTGSDQVWCHKRNFDIEPYFLTFVRNGGKRISYAPSMSVDSIPKEWEESYAKWINDYEAISVRESSDRDLLHNLTSKEIRVCLDPTFLISKNDWESLLPNKRIKIRYILLYSVGQYNKKLIKAAIDLANEKGFVLKVINPASLKKMYSKDYHSVFDAGPLEFVWLIRNAEFVFTDSYHGMIFSIIFNVPFLVDCGNYSTRFKELIDKLGLEANIFIEGKKNYNVRLNPCQQQILQEAILDSRGFLTKILKN